jgi:hypothetical protein
VEFLVFIFWPCHLGFIVGLLMPLRFIRWEDSSGRISIIPQKRFKWNPTSIFANYHYRGTGLCSTRIRTGLEGQSTNRTRTVGYLGAFSSSSSLFGSIFAMISIKKISLTGSRFRGV